MDFYFTDRKFNLLGIASTSSDAPISIFNDQDILSISAASRTFEGTLIFSAKERDQVKSMANYGNYILYKDENGQSIFMTIMEIEHDPKEGEHFIRAEDAGMDLINGLVDAYSATKAMTFAEYFKLFAGDTGFEIGINEISNLSRTLKWESESQTILARLLSLATQFDNAELSFSFEITGTQVVKRYVDVHKKRGADKRITLYMDKDINNIVTKANIYDLCTAIVATGGTPEGKNEPINLKGYNYKDPNGRFVLNKTTGVMQDMESVKIWSRLLSNNNQNPNAGHIQRVKTYETTDQKTLCDNVIRELEKASQPAINYETDIANLPDNVKIGDTIYLVDENEKLFLSARVLELTRCYSTNEYKATLGDYLIQDGGISQSLKELADQLKQATTYVWIRYADDEEGNGISALPAGKTYIAIKQVLGVPTASDDPADYRGLWVKFVGEGVPGPPGENGQPTYTWLKYADDYQGTNMTDDPTGKYYIGLATNKLTATESNDPKDYKWQLVKGEDGQDAHIYQAYSWSADGEDRFTTVYPNENLMINTQTPTSTSGPSVKGITAVANETITVYDGILKQEKKATSTTEFYYRFMNTTEGNLALTDLKPGKSYTLSLELRANLVSGGYVVWRAQYRKATGNWVNVTGWGDRIEGVSGDFKRFEKVLDIPSDAVTLYFSYQAYSSSAQAPEVGTIVEFRKAKLEENGHATIYTPSPSEDFLNAYPSYVGTYTTFDDVQSTNPADYTWQRMLGLSGEDGKDGEQGPQGVPGPKGDNGQTYYTWLKYADTPTSGMSDSPTGKTYIGLAYNKATATESTNYADYTWSLIKGSDGAQGPKGDNGQTLYTWIKYATSATGAGMSDSPTGKTYIGLAYNKTTANESTNAADYSWSLIKGDKGDTGPTGPQGPQGPAGPKGDRGIMGVAYMQPTQPSDTTEGATWFQTESSTSDKIIAVYTYKSGWQKKKYASATLAVESLDALSADLGKITAGIINGVEIQGDGLYSDYDYQIAEGSTVWRKGRLSMSGGYFRNDFQTYVKSTGEIQNNGFSQFSHEDLQFVVFNGSQKTKADRYLSINPYRFTMTDSRGLGGNLTFQDLYNIGKTGIPAASGWSQYSTSPSSGNFPSATRLGRMVQVSGAFKNNSTLPNTNDAYVVGVLPVGFRPQMQVKYLGKGAGTTIFMVTIDTNGEISISYRLGWTGSSFGYLTNNANDIFNIAGVFSAADV
ncbi:phage tail spike protein [Enterococcus gallinarum]|jgi:phage minor structural protein|uniref:phage tail spike protein n=1 Tax=Enterococcus gallinarum TaxID=1353 RepID=UPI0010DCC668|nr:phage tail spike protein [Enterococcus gallinarum]MDT2709429.1 phage tail spike protein [Enterococcus gallinarum]MDT2718456.1 phage tail spike protein [Enterococcus gallinarum]VTS79539.1 phage minor structural protein, N-terminal region [Enterococcus gallinarum]DAE56609.1 MAG TPA: tail protein [Caudoviricetes sp.]